MAVNTDSTSILKDMRPLNWQEVKAPNEFIIKQKKRIDEADDTNFVIQQYNATYGGSANSFQTCLELPNVGSRKA